MKLNIKDILSVKTDEKEYKSTILSFVLVILCVGALIAISNYIPIVLMSRFIAVGLTAFGFYLTIAFFSKLIFISENIEKFKIKNGNYKSKYKSVFITFEDMSNWLLNYSAPEQLIIKVNGKLYYIEISYDTKGRRGKYVNRKTYLDDVETNPSDILSFFNKNNGNDSIEVLETFDHNSPQILVEEIEEIKKQ